MQGTAMQSAATVQPVLLFMFKLHPLCTVQLSQAHIAWRKNPTLPDCQQLNDTSEQTMSTSLQLPAHAHVFLCLATKVLLDKRKNAEQ